MSKRLTIEKLRELREESAEATMWPTNHSRARCRVCGAVLDRYSGTGFTSNEYGQFFTCLHCEIASRPLAECWWNDRGEALHWREHPPECLPWDTDQVVTLEELRHEQAAG
jgi:hypothetical protein